MARARPEACGDEPAAIRGVGPDDGTETEYLATTKRLPEAQVKQMFAPVQSAATTENLTLDFDTIKVANSRRAHRLLHAAQAADAGASRRLRRVRA